MKKHKVESKEVDDYNVPIKIPSSIDINEMLTKVLSEEISKGVDRGILRVLQCETRKNMRKDKIENVFKSFE